MRKRFGSHLLQARIRRRLLQKQVALKAGVDPSYLAALEHDRRPPPKVRIVQRLADALDLSTEERRKVEEAVVLDRLTLMLQKEETNLRGASTLIQLVNTLPMLTNEEIDALAMLFDAMCYRGQPALEELPMK